MKQIPVRIDQRIAHYYTRARIITIGMISFCGRARFG